MPQNSTDIEIIEQKRLYLLYEFESRVSQRDRNEKGQFATPFDLAKSIVSTSLSFAANIVSENMRILDPAVGSGVFFSAAFSCGRQWINTECIGFDIDEKVTAMSKKIWNGINSVRIIRGDFTAENPEGFDIILCNPPYSRHHHIDREEKHRLCCQVRQHAGVELSGLAGLHCYFLILSSRWLNSTGVAAFLVPSEILDVNYGKEVRSFLLDNVNVLRIHRFEASDVQFDDALVTSMVIWFKKGVSRETILFTSGPVLESPRRSLSVSVDILKKATKWGPIFASRSIPPSVPVSGTTSSGVLGDYFFCKRGIATGCNKFFILSYEQVAHLQIPSSFIVPLLPPPRNLHISIIRSDEDGQPILPKNQKLFLLSCSMEKECLQTSHPLLWEYVNQGEFNGVSRGYLCSRKIPWYKQEVRDPAPIVCTYMGRSKGESIAFKFIANYSRAVVTNCYLMLYPTERFLALVKDNLSWRELIATSLGELTQDVFSSVNRSYGGGLQKMEPQEILQLPFNIDTVLHRHDQTLNSPLVSRKRSRK